MSARPSATRLVGALVVVQVLFGALSVSGKFVLPYVPPLALALSRLAAAALILFALERIVVRSRMPPARDLAGFALLGVVLNQGLFLMGLARTSASHAVLLVATIPAFTLGVATLLRHERPTPIKLMGLALSFAGVATLVVASGFDLSQGSTVGNLMIAANALSYSVYLVLSRPYLSRYDPLTVIAWTFLFGAVEMALVAAPQLVAVDWAALTPVAWWNFAYILLGATVMTYGLNNWALRHAPASQVASFVYLQPLVGVVLAWVVLDEALTLPVLVAGALILGGVAVANRVAPGRRGPGA
jgi:drug/metabolite transporter (DMT)-like permease